jgi:hypothetical protein
VTAGGKPVYSGTISFIVGKEQPVGGPIKNGSYKVDGIPLGEAKVVVISPRLQPAAKGSKVYKPDPKQLEKMPKQARKEYADRERKEKEAKAKWVAIPEKYTEVDSTTLKHDVKKGATQFNAKCD